MKNYEVIQNYKNLIEVGSNEDLSLPVKVLYARSKNVKMLEELVKVFESTRNDLIRKYGSADDEGQTSVDPNNEEFSKDLNELINCDNDILLCMVSVNDLPAEMPIKTYELLSCMVAE